MAQYTLDRDEGIVLQSTNAERYGASYDDFENEELHELVLTNKNIIYVILKSTGFFKEQEVVLKVPLSEIKVINGKVQIKQIKHDDYGLCLQVQFVHGIEYWELGKKVISEWEIALDQMLSIHEEPVDEKQAEPVPLTKHEQERIDPVPLTKKAERKSVFSEALAGSSAVFAGIKGAIDTAKQTVSEAVQSATDSFTGSSADVSTPKQEYKSTESGERKYIYCTNCGEKLAIGSKFCSNCGTQTGTIVEHKAPPKAETAVPPPINTPRVEQYPVTPSSAAESSEKPKSERTTVYDGEIYKCPNCGDILDAYESVCESCGYERRGAKATSSVRELSLKLQQIEAQRPPKKVASIFKQAFTQGQLSTTDEQKIDLIKNFAIPNAKEDIIEFAVLAVSNIDPDAFSSMNNTAVYDTSRKAVSNAWMAKFEQAYQKGKLMFGESPELQNMYQHYQEKKKAIKRKKASIWLLLGGIYGFIIVLTLSIVLATTISSNNSKAEEAARLENLITQIATAIDDGDYKLALMYADRIRYNGSADEEIERDWEIQRDYWIDKVIEEAAENGVVLERPSSPQTSGDSQVDSSGKISIGGSQYSFKYRNFLEVKQELEDRGFTNVKTEGLKDLTSDWLAQDGNVEKVTVDGETGFTESITYPPDVEIIIYHHSHKD